MTANEQARVAPLQEKTTKAQTKIRQKEDSVCRRAEGDDHALETRIRVITLP
jgi:hypothetical protein